MFKILYCIYYLIMGLGLDMFFFLSKIFKVRLSPKKVRF